MRCYLLSCIAVVCAVVLACGVCASEVSVAMDLQFNTPGDTNSGGIWTVVAKTDERGLAALRMVINDANFDEDTGFLAPESFEVQRGAQFPLFLDVIAGDDMMDPVYDVGVIGNWPTNFPNDSSYSPMAGYPDLGSFAGGVALATGSFDQGVIPTWFDNRPDGNDFTNANLFLDESGTAVAAESMLLTIRTIPEPATFALFGLSFMLIVAATRRRA